MPVGLLSAFGLATAAGLNDSSPADGGRPTWHRYTETGHLHPPSTSLKQSRGSCSSLVEIMAVLDFVEDKTRPWDLRVCRWSGSSSPGRGGSPGPAARQSPGELNPVLAAVCGWLGWRGGPTARGCGRCDRGRQWPRGLADPVVSLPGGRRVLATWRGRS